MDLFDGILAPQAHVINPPITKDCWICETPITVRSRLAKIMVCPNCESSVQGTTVEERRRLLDARDRLAVWEIIRSTRRNTPLHRSIPGAPPVYANAVATGDVSAWARRPRPHLAVLHGLTGRGKTWQAWGAIRIAGGQLLHAADLGRPGDHLDEAMLAAGIVVIDDLAAKTTAATINAALRLIDVRSSWHRATLITTNLDGQGLAAIDPRLASRLAASEMIEIAGPDRRRGTAA